MSSEPLISLQKCSKVFFKDYKAARIYTALRVFLAWKKVPNFLAPQAVWALNNLNFSVRPGEKIMLVGRPKCGKSTLGFILAGTMRPSMGKVHVHSYAGYFGRRMSLPAPLITLKHFVEITGYLAGNRLEGPENSAENILETLGLSHRKNIFVRDLFPSETEKVILEVISRGSNPFVVLDEPSEDVLNPFLKRKDFETMTMVLISSRPRLVLERYSKLVLMSAGTIVYEGGWEQGLQVLEDLPEEADEGLAGSADNEMDSEESDSGDDMEDDGGEDADGKRIFADYRRGREQINTYLERTKGYRKGANGVQVVSMATVPHPTPEELADRLTFSPGSEQCLYVRLQVQDETLLGKPLNKLVCRITNSIGLPVLTLSPSVFKWAPLLNETEFTLVYRFKKLGLTPGEYGIRFSVSVAGEIHDKIEAERSMTVTSGDFFGYGLFPKNDIGEACMDFDVRIIGKNDEVLGGAGYP